MLAHLMTTAMHAAENGRLPDSLVRLGIRRLLTERLRQETSGNCEQRQQKKRSFIRSCCSSPVAVVPELANSQHYEVPTELFLASLGQRLKYSCCYFEGADQDLDAAEESALRITCERADLRNGQEILELGCGWGSLTLWMAEQFPDSKITAVSNSASQRRFILDRARERGLNHVNVVTSDMNSFVSPVRPDRVVSVEMFEHMRNHHLLLSRIAGWLAPGGRLFVHIFCHRDTPYLFETADGGNSAGDWMSQHFFSGGMMPSEDLLLHCQQHLRLTDRWNWSGLHYAQTCDQWLAKFDRNHDKLTPILEQTYGKSEVTKWRHRWRMFFMACSELFAFRGGDEWKVAHYLFERPEAWQC